MAIELYRVNNNFDALIDKKDPIFLKGQLLPDGKTQGARINILPCGEELSKAFSLFAPQLMIHDERSNYHWDVIYRNLGGTFSYLYTTAKKRMFTIKKYKLVKEFEKYCIKLYRNAYKALSDENDFMAVPMYTLLKTCMRVGSETYYKISHHQGLTTLKKEDILIRENRVLFNYIAKDGVPINIESEFPDIYIKRLEKILQNTKDGSFVFINHAVNHAINDTHFKDAFKKYCGKEFYPHIIRSYYATLQAKKFLKTHKSATKEDVQKLFIAIAEKLGHKRFAKKDGIWKENYTVTINHYIQPELVRNIKACIVKRTKKK